MSWLPSDLVKCSLDLDSLLCHCALLLLLVLMYVRLLYFALFCTALELHSMCKIRRFEQAKDFASSDFMCVELWLGCALFYFLATVRSRHCIYFSPAPRRKSHASMIVEVELFLEPYLELAHKTFFWRRIVRAPNATWLTASFREDTIP